MDLQRELHTIVDVLNTAGIPYAVCGGLAVALHGYPRATQDLDILIREADLAAAKMVLETVGYLIPAGMIAFRAGTPQEQSAFRVSRMLDGELLTLDLMLVTPIMADVWDDRISLSLDSRDISVVSREGLGKMKRLAGRYKDLADLEGLGLPLESQNEPAAE